MHGRNVSLLSTLSSVLKSQAILASAGSCDYMLSEARFTDYSGRTFLCTAYEYAYRAKDTYMCCMLEKYMDEDTKAKMLQRIIEIEKSGLAYYQGMQKNRSAHFDLTPLKQALQTYVEIAARWEAGDHNSEGFNGLNPKDVAMKAIGMAQCDVPAHVAQEYCRKGRSFVSCPKFNETSLPREFKITLRSYRGLYINWFPLATLELGYTYIITNAGKKVRGGGATDSHIGEHPQAQVIRADLAAITKLDEVRTNELKQAHEHLSWSSGLSAPCYLL